MLDADEPARFDWVIKGDAFWSFHDPRTSVCRHIVDLDQVEAIDVESLAFHDDVDERNNFAYLLKQALSHQVRQELSWDKEKSFITSGPRLVIRPGPSNTNPRRRPPKPTS